MQKIYAIAEYSWTHRQDVTFQESNTPMHRGERDRKFSGNKGRLKTPFSALRITLRHKK